ncbi:TPA: hypothetical protein ACH3X2_013630 [Trebouxia sp. C0005]
MQHHVSLVLVILLTAFNFFAQKSWTQAQPRGSSTNSVLKQLQATASKNSFSMLVCLVPGSVDKNLPVADCPPKQSIDILMAFESADIDINTSTSALHVLCLRTLPSGLSAFLYRLMSPDTCPQGCRDFHSPVKCLEHRYCDRYSEQSCKAVSDCQL